MPSYKIKLNELFHGNVLFFFFRGLVSRKAVRSFYKKCLLRGTLNFKTQLRRFEKREMKNNSIGNSRA